jgi:hypothetical protein
LAEAARTVRHLVREADESRRANPRRRFHPRDLDLDYRNLRDLERVTFHIQDMTEVLSDVIWAEDVPYKVPLEDSEPLAAALDTTGQLLASLHTGDESEQRRLFAAAKSAVEVRMAGAEGGGSSGAVTASESILLSLHRILRALRPTS